MAPKIKNDLEENNNKDKEFFVIEENNKSYDINKINDLTKSNNNKVDKFNKKENNEYLENEEFEEKDNYIIDYDDETNSLPPNKSNFSDKNNIDEKSNKFSNKKENGTLKKNREKRNNRNNRKKEDLYFNNKSLKIEKKLNIDIDTSDGILEGGKTFSEIEEENRINYLLSSKNNIKENEAMNIINLKKTINDVIKLTNNNIQKINDLEANKSKSKKNSKEKANNNNKKLENNIINTPIKVENIKLIGKKNDEKKDKSNNILMIEKINVPSFNNKINTKESINQNNIYDNSSNKKNSTNNIEKYSIIYNNEFSFAPETLSQKRDYLNMKNSNANFNTNNKDNKNKENFNSNKNKDNLKNSLNEITDLDDGFINKKYFSNNIINQNNDNYIEKKNLENIEFYKYRIINDEMILNFLNNHKNERILKLYDDTKKVKDIEISNNFNNNISNYDYKNKYLGYTLEGDNTKNSLKKEFYGSKNNEIDDNTKKSINGDNDNNISGLNKICNMLDDLFYEDNLKKNKNINTQKKENIINEYKTKNYNNNKISLHKNIKTENNCINNITPFETSKIRIKNNSNTLDFSKENEYLFNNKTNEKRQILSNKEREYLINKNKIRAKTCFSENKNKNNMNYPLSTMNFNQRLKHFTSKKMFDLEKIKNNLINKEEDIYTFYPRTNKNISNGKKDIEKNVKNKCKYKNTNNNKRKTKLNYKRLNELYLDYKERKARIKKLEKENDIKDGISFIPYFFTHNQKSSKSRGKIKKNNLFLNNI